MWMVAGASGGTGPSARSLVEVESSSGEGSVTTRPLRVVGEAAWESLNSRETATRTCAQVVLIGRTLLSLQCCCVCKSQYGVSYRLC